MKIQPIDLHKYRWGSAETEDGTSKETANGIELLLLYQVGCDLDILVKEEALQLSRIFTRIVTIARTNETISVLTYRHELGMNYNFIRPDLIVGSCLQTLEDVDKLQSIRVNTIYCLQQDPDLAYFSVDIDAIREYANTFDDIQHLRAEIRDFDGTDLRLRLPAMVSKLHKAVNRNGGVTYIHCTAGLGRSPATVLAYMFWVQGFKLNNALSLLLRNRKCFPNVDAIKSATADIYGVPADDYCRSSSMDDFKFGEWSGTSNFRFVGPALTVNQSNDLLMADFYRRTVSTIWHYHGGCVVGRVVDHNLKVVGVHSLRVLDGSTFTVSPGTNPQATLLMLGRYMGMKILRERMHKSSA